MGGLRGMQQIDFKCLVNIRITKPTCNCNLHCKILLAVLTVNFVAHLHLQTQKVKFVAHL